MVQDDIHGKNAMVKPGVHVGKRKDHKGIVFLFVRAIVNGHSHTLVKFMPLDE